MKCVHRIFPLNHCDSHLSIQVWHKFRWERAFLIIRYIIYICIVVMEFLWLATGHMLCYYVMRTYNKNIRFNLFIEAAYRCAIMYHNNLYLAKLQTQLVEVIWRTFVTYIPMYCCCWCWCCCRMMLYSALCSFCTSGFGVLLCMTYTSW